MANTHTRTHSKAASLPKEEVNLATGKRDEGEIKKSFQFAHDGGGTQSLEKCKIRKRGSKSRVDGRARDSLNVRSGSGAAPGEEMRPSGERELKSKPTTSAAAEACEI